MLLLQYYSTEYSTVFLYSLLSGIILYLIYAVFEFVRIFFKNNRAVCITADILFMTVASLVTFILSLAFNNGRVRLFTCMGELMGFFVMLFTVGRVTKRVFAYVLIKTKKICCIILKFFKKVTIKPLKKLQGLLYNKNG